MIGISIGTKLLDWKLDDNLFLNLLEIWIEFFLRFTMKKHLKFEFYKTRPEFFHIFKQFSWILGLGASIADFGLGDPGSNLEGSNSFLIFFYIFAFLSTCGKPWDNANFKMGSAVTVINQEIEIYYVNELWRKKYFWQWSDLKTGTQRRTRYQGTICLALNFLWKIKNGLF